MSEPNSHSGDVLAPVASANSPEHISQTERFSIGSTHFANLTALVVVDALRQAERGDIKKFANLGDFMLSGPDGWLGAKFLVRAQRVAQADFKVGPGRLAPTPNDQLAAEMCDQVMREIPRLTKIFLQQLDAVPMGLAAHHMGWGRSNRIYAPESIAWIHMRRFRYDLQWRTRLWDGGEIPGPDGYGRVIDAEPAEWMIHQHATRGTYPGLYGELRKCTKLALFMKFCSEWWVQNSEKYGSPFVWARHPKDWKPEQRAKLKAGLQAIANDHAGIAEEGTELFFEVAAAASRSFENYSELLAYCKANLTEIVLGTSDAAGPGENGSNAAVTTRMGALTDPIMIADGEELADTWRESVFKWIVYFNRHKFAPGPLPATPTMRFLTADDEVKVDAGDKTQEIIIPGEASAPAAFTATKEPRTADGPLAIALSARRPLTATTAKRPLVPKIV